jgi:hypothetical protein
MRVIGLLPFLVLAVHVSAVNGNSLPLRVLPCSSWSGDTESDGWALVKAANGTSFIQNTQKVKNCLEAVHVGNGAFEPMASPCNNDRSQQWLVSDSGLGMLLQSAVDPLSRCLAVASSAYTVGPGLLLSECNPNPSGSGGWFLGKYPMIPVLKPKV